MAGYNDKLDADAQITMEEWIADKIFNGTAAGEAAANFVSKGILLEVLRRFRPDLVED
jgi:hypothetical protein